MSLATAMNLAIAAVEERPKAVRKILRDLPLDEMPSLRQLVSRIDCAVERRILRGIYNTLMEVERISSQMEPKPSLTPAELQAFYEGLDRLEQIIDGQITDLRFQLGMDREEEDTHEPIND